METVPCPHCEAPLKPTATFCLACNKPVVPETSRLSVGEPTQVKVGRPMVGIAIILGVVLLLGVAAYGTFAFVHHQRASSQAQAIKDVKRATTLLVDAQGGKESACRRAHLVVAGPPDVTRSQCEKVLNRDPGLRADKVVVDQLKLAGKNGTARVRTTVTDSSGTRTVEHVVSLIKVGKVWRLSWDGSATV